MKLRRAMAIAAATAVIAPAAFLAAPAAYADGDPATTTQTETTTDPDGDKDPGEATDPGAPDPDPEPPVDEPDPADADPDDENPTDPSDPTDPADETDPVTDPTDPDPADEDPAADPDGETDPAADPDGEADPDGDTDPATDPDGETDPGEDEDPGTDPGEEDPSTDPDEDGEEPVICESSDLELEVKGLPGKIAAGSGWREFSLNVYNSSETTVSQVDYFAGASFDKDGMELLKSNQVSLQAFNDETKNWENLVAPDGSVVGYVGQSDEIKPGYEVDIAMRLNVKADAPAGAAFTLGAGLYIGDEDCFGFADVAYRFEIVKAGTPTDDTKPQEGGKAPVPSEKPTENTAPAVTGALAETGSSSKMPMFALAGGAAVALGAGAMFVVRRRQAGSEA